MKHLLVGNGLNIQFGGRAYTSEFIMKRIKFKARLDAYDELFEGTLKANDIENLLKVFAIEAEKVRMGEYDSFLSESDILDAVNDFKNRYKNPIKEPHQVMVEDWLLLIYLWYSKNTDIIDQRNGSTVGFCRLLLDSIYNEGKIEHVLSSLDNAKKKSLRRFIEEYEDVYTLNYDSNVEQISRKPVYHLHGQFSVLTESLNPDFAMGYARIKNDEVTYQDKYKHCYCNALLDFSGSRKRTRIEACDMLNDKSNTQLISDLIALSIIQPDAEKIVNNTLIAKAAHPELHMATNYHYHDFCQIADELDIVGMSPCNDAHIFDAVLRNSKIIKVTYYYVSESEAEYMKDLFGANHSIECRSVFELWKRLGLENPKYNVKFDIPEGAGSIFKALNAISQDTISEEQAIKEARSIPLYRVNELCKLVKEDMDSRNPTHSSTDEKGFMQQATSISYIALQEGIEPTTLAMLCVKYNHFLH